MGIFTQEMLEDRDTKYGLGKRIRKVHLRLVCSQQLQRLHGYPHLTRIDINM